MNIDCINNGISADTLCPQLAATAPMIHARTKRAAAQTTPCDAVLANTARTGVRASSPAAYQLHDALLARMGEQFPDIERQAKLAIEAQIEKDYGLKLDADQHFYNYFTPNAYTNPPLQILGDGAYEGRAPYPSMTLAQAQIWALTQALPATIEDNYVTHAGIYTQGRPSTSFGPHNKVALSAAQFLRAARNSGFIEQYEKTLRNYWNNNLGALQTLNELEVFDYATTHRLAGHRAQGLGLPGDGTLSDAALAMLATASGRRDPDLPLEPIEMFRFDINGWASQDIVWIRHAHSGHVVLYIPDAPVPVHEYANTQAMCGGIRAMLATPEGRDNMARHFSQENRRDGWFYAGIDQWLRTLGNDQAGSYDYAIAHTPQRLDGKLVLPPSTQATPLLSDKALAMIAEASTSLGSNSATHGHRTRAYVFDIAGLAASDMIWLQADDGHVVLLMPGDPRPVREYADLQALRQDIAAMLTDHAARQRLASHFGPALRDDNALGGLEYWFDEISKAPLYYGNRIIHAPQDNTVQGDMFITLTNRIRDHQFAGLQAIRDTNWSAYDIMSEQREGWSTQFTRAGRPLHAARASASVTETQKQSQPSLPGMHDGPMVAQWARSLTQRLAFYQSHA